MPLPHTTFPTPVADMADVYGLRLPPSKKSQPGTTTSSSAAAPSSSSTALSSSKHNTSSTNSFSLARVFKRKERASPAVDASQSTGLSRRASLDSQRTLAAAPSIQASKGPSKDYEAAFGVLASSYGTGGGMPIQPAPTKAIKK